VSTPPLAPPGPAIPISLGGAPPVAGAPSSLYQRVSNPTTVTTPSGSQIMVLGQMEAEFYNKSAKHYRDENEFTNASDVLDLDRLLFYELQVFRMGYWLARGTDYDGMDISPVELRRNLKEVSDQLSRVKNDLGLTKAAREKAQAESVGAYLMELKQRAKEFGVHREKQLGKGLELCKQLFSIVAAFDRADAVEREKLGFRDSDEVLAWIRDTMKPEFDEVDDHFRTHQQKYWVRDI
jgi:hypothetical protein